MHLLALILLIFKNCYNYLIVFVNIIQKKIAQNQPMLNPMVVQPGYVQPAAAPLVGQNAPYPNTYQAQSPSPYPS